MNNNNDIQEEIEKTFKSFFQINNIGNEIESTYTIRKRLNKKERKIINFLNKNITSTRTREDEPNAISKDGISTQGRDFKDCELYDFLGFNIILNPHKNFFAIGKETIEDTYKFNNNLIEFKINEISRNEASSISRLDFNYGIQNRTVRFLLFYLFLKYLDEDLRNEYNGNSEKYIQQHFFNEFKIKSEDN